MDRRLLILLLVAGAVIAAGCTSSPSAKPGASAPPGAKTALECSKLQGLAKDRCISLAAQKANDDKQCGAIQDKAVKTYCMANVAAAKQKAAQAPQPVSCATQRPAQRDACYKLLAVKVRDGSFCLKIADAKAKQDCSMDVKRLKMSTTAISCADRSGAARDTCYYALALETKKTDSCAKIANVTVKDECLRKIGILTNKPEVAAQISSPVKKDALATSIAVKKKDPSECTKVSDPDRRAVCAAIVNGNPAPCESMNRVRAGECFYGIALAKNDATFCAKTRSTNQQWTCYETLAIQTQNDKLCDNTYYGTRCRDRVAEAKKFGSAPTPTPVIPP